MRYLLILALATSQVGCANRELIGVDESDLSSSLCVGLCYNHDVDRQVKDFGQGGVNVEIQPDKPNAEPIVGKVRPAKK